MPQPRSQKLLKVREVAHELGRSYVTVISYIRKGHIRAIKVGGQWRIKQEELERFKSEGNYEGGCI
jgi:excisionase family DNA binding protein